ncbi:MAG: hypothetical protein A2X46_12620 [Lentisphaerae bacterium GWF2_57_35]|nr:MAG: hypothetical protein A2X46_12620 [Lentisphaerae bacterium GWF2_57_35]
MGLMAGTVMAQTSESRTVSAQLQSNLESLDALLRTIQSKEAATAKTRQALQEARDEVTRANLLEDLRELTAEEAELQAQFTEFAVAVDASVFSDAPEKAFNWQEELASLLKPILAEFKSATAESRALGELRGQIHELEQLHAIAQRGAANLEKLMAPNPSGALRERLESELRLWRQRRDDAYHQKRALQLQLDNRLAARKSPLDSATQYAQTFFKTRGLNLAMGLGAFFLLFFGLRILHAAYRKVRPSRKRADFATRLGALIFHVFSVVGGLVATLLVFNLVGDWFLLGIVTILLIGMAWAGIKTLPQHIETVKLVLNVGAVKEKERLMFDDMPWQVDSIGFTVRLVNPLLSGGVQTLPVTTLVGLHSRVNGEREEWFPCREGDWVELADGHWGRVAYQTPSSVQLVELGGSQIVYPTPAFIALNPKVLSTNFRVSTVFGIDYRHQAASTREIPDLMKDRLSKALSELVGAEQLLNVLVVLKAAGASSLDYAVAVDVTGAAAPQYKRIEWAIARILVETCTEQGWTIPFPQLTVHPAQKNDQRRG